MSPPQVYDVIATSLRRISLVLFVSRLYDCRTTLTWLCIIKPSSECKCQTSHDYRESLISQQLWHIGKILRYLHLQDEYENGFKINTLYVATHIANRKCVDINIGETFYSHSTQESYLYHKKQTYTLMISCSTSVEIRPFNTKFPGAIPQCIFYILKRWSFNRYFADFCRWSASKCDCRSNGFESKWQRKHGTVRATIWFVWISSRSHSQWCNSSFQLPTWYRYWAIFGGTTERNKLLNSLWSYCNWR